MDYLKNLLSRYWRTGIVVVIGIVLIVYIAFGFLFLQQGSLQEDTEQKIAQIKPILSKELPSRAELQQEYDDLMNSIKAATDGNVIVELVNLAEVNGIDVNEESGYFKIPIAGYSSIRIGSKTYGVINFRGIKVQGGVDDVLNFISDIQSGIIGENITIKLTSVSVSEMQVAYTGEEGIRRAEFRSVIQAVNAMMLDNNLESIPNPVNYSGGLATNYMGDDPETVGIIEGFPDNVTSGFEKGYTGNLTIRSGYVLYGHDKVDPDYPTQYSSKYYYGSYETIYYYTCDRNGLVRQWSASDINSATEYTETEVSRAELALTINVEIIYRSE